MKVLMINSVCGIRSTGRICTDLAQALEEKGYPVKIAYGRENVPMQYEKYAIKIGKDLSIKTHAVFARLFDADGRGSMSEANVRYVLNHNPDVDPQKVAVCPNCVEVSDKSADAEERRTIREKYGIPLDKTVFAYGGNLGRPQGIPFLIECLRKARESREAFFLIVGGGSDYGKLEAYVQQENPEHVKLMSQLPKEDYDSMVGACDVGMIFLDHRFTIPNFPSRLLAYMQAKLPVLAVTDPNTDIGKVIVEGGFGWWCESNDTSRFLDCVRTACAYDLNYMKEAEFQYLMDHYSTEEAYRLIMKALS